MANLLDSLCSCKAYYRGDPPRPTCVIHEAETVATGRTDLPESHGEVSAIPGASEAYRGAR